MPSGELPRFTCFGYMAQACVAVAEEEYSHMPNAEFQPWNMDWGLGRMRLQMRMR